MYTIAQAVGMMSIIMKNATEWHKPLMDYMSLQLCQLCTDNPDITILKVDWDQNKQIAKPLGVKVHMRFIYARFAVTWLVDLPEAITDTETIETLAACRQHMYASKSCTLCVSTCSILLQTKSHLP